MRERSAGRSSPSCRSNTTTIALAKIYVVIVTVACIFCMALVGGLQQSARAPKEGALQSLHQHPVKSLAPPVSSLKVLPPARQVGRNLERSGSTAEVESLSQDLALAFHRSGVLPREHMDITETELHQAEPEHDEDAVQLKETHPLVCVGKDCHIENEMEEEKRANRRAGIRDAKIDRVQKDENRQASPRHHSPSASAQIDLKRMLEQKRAQQQNKLKHKYRPQWVHHHLSWPPKAMLAFRAQAKHSIQDLIADMENRENPCYRSNGVVRCP